MNKHLVVLGCSSIKVQSEKLLPSIFRYDELTYRVLQAYLRTARWPQELSIGIMSAKYGLIGGLTPIENYDQRMDSGRAERLRKTAINTLIDWYKRHQVLHS